MTAILPQHHQKLEAVLYHSAFEVFEEVFCHACRQYFFLYGKEIYFCSCWLLNNVSHVYELNLCQILANRGIHDLTSYVQTYDSSSLLLLHVLATVGMYLVLKACSPLVGCSVCLNCPVV